MRHQSVTYVLYLAFVAMALAAPGRAAALRVKPDAPGPIHDGMSWATGFTSIQAAMDAASAGDEVWVAWKVHRETITMKADVALLGGFSGIETARDQRDRIAHETVLDGNGQGNVVTIPPGASRATVVDGFTIRNGSGTSPNGTARYGGGLYSEDASPTITHNIFQDNHVENQDYHYGSVGGGVYIYGGSPLLADNLFIRNGVTGVYAVQATVEARNNVATGNGYGFWFSGCVLTVVNNTVAANLGVGINLTGVPSRGLIANNLIVTNGGYGIEAVSSPVLSHNCAYGNREYDFRYGDSLIGTNGNINKNPRLAADGLHLRPDSPCVDAGDDSAVRPGEMDMDGQVRIQGDHVDIGADEFDFSYTIPPPPPIVHVGPDGDDANDGATWERAKKTLAGAAFDLALFGGEIWAAAGTYAGRVEVADKVTLYGGFLGTEAVREARDPRANETVIMDGRVVVLSGVSSAVVDGFTFKKGSGISSLATSLTVSHNHFVQGGVEQDGGSVSVTDNVFGGETAWGIGVFARGAYVTIARNTISQRDVGGNAYGAITPVNFSGGAVMLWSCTGLVTGNVVRDNVNYSGNATVSYGGGAGIYALNSTLFITRNVITGNSVAMQAYDYAFPQGGGLLGDGGTLVIADNLVKNNGLFVGGDYGGSGAGAGIFLRGGSALVVNNTVSGNTVSGAEGPSRPTKQGGGLYVVWSEGDPGAYTVANNIIAFNDTGVDWYDAAPQWTHNDVFGNGQDYPADMDPTGTNGNLRLDPLFVDRAGGDYRLSPLSPCLDAGDDLAAAEAYDLDGRFRIQGRHVDLGAYEFPVGSRKTMADVARALRIGGGLAIPDGSTEVYRLNATGFSQQIDLLDVARLARKAAGLDANP